MTSGGFRRPGTSTDNPSSNSWDMEFKGDYAYRFDMTRGVEVLRIKKGVKASKKMKSVTAPSMKQDKFAAQPVGARHLAQRQRRHELFLREAGDPSQPAVVLLHGFPASSFMFRDLIAALSDRYYVVAPDHLGFGRSASPSVDEFEYTFERLSEVTLALLDRLELAKFALYVQDYGAPIGFRIASRHPDQVTALISQNGNAYEEGFTPFWDGLFAFAADGVTNEADVRASLEAPGTRWVYTHGVPADRLERLSPDTWTLDQVSLDRPGNREVQLALFRDYRFNLDEYPAFQEYFRAHQPPALVVWGEHDEIFGPDGARAFGRDLPDAEIHLLNAGHYALETSGGEIAALVRSFLGRVL